MALLKRLELPPVWTLLFMALVWALRTGPAFPWIGGAIVALAIALAVWAALHFWRARTTIIPRETPSALVTGGPFRISRNPIYLADLLVVAGWSLAIGAPLGLLLVPVLALVLERRFIHGEEAGLRAAFPAAWDAWASRTRRWI